MEIMISLSSSHNSLYNLSEISILLLTLFISSSIQFNVNLELIELQHFQQRCNRQDLQYKFIKLKMYTDYFSKGSFYLIVCLAGERALKIERSELSESHKSQVIGATPDPEDNGQIFMVENFLEDDHYEIINCVSNLVLEHQVFSKKIRFHTGARQNSQLFKIEPSNFQGPTQYFRIMQGNHALSLDDFLYIENFDEKNEKQLFKFVEVTNAYIQNSAVLANALSDKAIEIPESSQKHGDIIHLWEKTNRWKQRWHFEKQQDGNVIIRNIFNRLCLSVWGEPIHKGSKVVQQEKTGKVNQLWKSEYTGDGLFKFRSAMSQEFCLSVKDQDTRNGSHLEVSLGDYPSMYWKIEVKLKEVFDASETMDLIMLISPFQGFIIMPDLE